MNLQPPAHQAEHQTKQVGWKDELLQKKKKKLCSHHKDSNSSHLVSALNATVAVRRVQSRHRRSEEGKEEPSVLVSQVLNPELPLNQSGIFERCQLFIG